jgi:hypothetical protein
MSCTDYVQVSHTLVTASLVSIIEICLLVYLLINLEAIYPVYA